MATTDNLQEQSKNLTQLLQKETETIDNLIVDFKKGMATQADLILNTDYFTNIRPTLVEAMYSIGKDDGKIVFNSDLEKFGFTLDTSINRYKQSRELLSDDASLAGIKANFKQVFSHEGNFFELLVAQKCNYNNALTNDYRLIINLNTHYASNIKMELNVEGSKKYVSLIKDDAKVLFIEYVAGFVESNLENSKNLNSNQIQTDKLVSLMEKYDVMQSDGFRLYLNNLNNSAQNGDRPSIKALGVIDVYFAKEKENEMSKTN